MLDLYKNIKIKRKELNMTQTELALKMGYSDKSMIAKIEAGKIDLPQSKIEAFAKVLDTLPGALMGWETPISSKREKDLLEKYGKFNNHGKDYIDQQVDFALQHDEYLNKPMSKKEA